MGDEANIVFNNVVTDVFLLFIPFFRLKYIYIVTLDHTRSSSSRRETWIGTSPRLKSSGNRKQENLLELKYIYFSTDRVS